MVFHNEDGNPARANIKQALGRPHKGVKASANSDVMYFFTSAQDGDPLQDDVRLCLGDDLKKAQDHISSNLQRSTDAEAYYIKQRQESARKDVELYLVVVYHTPWLPSGQQNENTTRPNLNLYNGSASYLVCGGWGGGIEEKKQFSGGCVLGVAGGEDERCCHLDLLVFGSVIRIIRPSKLPISFRDISPPLKVTTPGGKVTCPPEKYRWYCGRVCVETAFTLSSYQIKAPQCRQTCLQLPKNLYSELAYTTSTDKKNLTESKQQLQAANNIFTFKRCKRDRQPASTRESTHNTRKLTRSKTSRARARSTLEIFESEFELHNTRLVKLASLIELHKSSRVELHMASIYRVRA
ncbi:hypothetical protein Tco_0704776 [Tanacetum coccineum]|uniref:Uncharacterized protein n=1 Tax=Tanacetum coccineum TaxID=301880 RepID=A0ABQ4Y4I3_9ASTR